MSGDRLVSVIMPVFNCEKYVISAMQSVLSQAYTNFELIVVSDGSTDRTNDEIRMVRDSRVTVQINDRNQGIAAARNHGIGLAKGDYIAWLDADDIASPDRLLRQVAFLEQNQDVGLVAANAISIDADGRALGRRWWNRSSVPVDWMMLWGNPIAQSSVMLRRSLLNGGTEPYVEEFAPAEDYHLWCRLARKTRFHRLDDVLLHYRVLPSSAYRMNWAKALAASLQANRLYLEDLVRDVVPEFHPYLTTFAGVLPPRTWMESAQDIWVWMERTRACLEEAKGLLPHERRAIRGNMRRAFFDKVWVKGRLPPGRGNRGYAVSKTPDVFAAVMWETLLGKIKETVKRILVTLR